MKNIFIKYFNYNLTELKNINGENSDWIDLRASKRIELKRGEFKLIPLGVAMILPKGYEAIIAPRSSTFKNYGILQTNGIGVIDQTYCGDSDEWMMGVYATRDAVIEENDRICQFRIFKNQPKISFTKLFHFNKENRGGFGSSGVK